MAARGLGKGLDSLIPKAISEPSKQEKEEKKAETMVKITMVEPNGGQPRKNFDEDSLMELAESIKQFGLLQPILVQDKKGHYEIIAGERRWRAAKIAGLKEIPVIIKELTDQEVVEISLIENIQTIGSRLITRRATIGGTIATKDFTTSFPGTLIALDATAEVRFIKKKRLHSRWLQITRLLDKSGRIVLPPQGMISRVRIAFIEKNCQYFKEVGSFMLDPENSVAVAFTAMLDQDILINPKIAFTYPTHGVCYSRDIDNIFSSLRFPVYDEELNTLESMIFTFIESSFQNISPLQKTRTRGLLYEIIDALNEETLTIPTEER